MLFSDAVMQSLNAPTIPLGKQQLFYCLTQVRSVRSG